MKLYTPLATLYFSELESHSVILRLPLHAFDKAMTQDPTTAEAASLWSAIDRLVSNLRSKVPVL